VKPIKTNPGVDVKSERSKRFIFKSLAPAVGLTLLLANASAGQTGTTEADTQEPNASALVETDSSKATLKLQETVTVTAVVGPQSTILSDLIDAANKRDPKVQRSTAEVNKYGEKIFLFKTQASDAINSVFMHKGVSVSSEAGDVILDEKLKLNGLGAAKLLNEKLRDELELQVIASTLELASAIGSAEPTNSDIDEATKQLATLVGDENANKARIALANQMAGLVSAPAGKVWSVPQLEHRVQTAVQAAAINDRIADDIRHDVHKYNTHTSTILGAHRFLRTALCIASLSPNAIGPAAQGLLFGYVLMTGGSEQSKLLKELYMDKRLESRATALREESHLAFDNYRVGVLTKNKVLASVSEQLLGKLTTPVMAHQLLTSAECPVVDAHTVEQALAEADSESLGKKNVFKVNKLMTAKHPKDVAMKVMPPANSAPVAIEAPKAQPPKPAAHTDIDSETDRTSMAETEKPKAAQPTDTD